MEIYVIGGTGIIGTGIVEAAILNGHSVTALSRQERPIHDTSLNVHYIKADWADIDQAKAVMKNVSVDVIVDGCIFNEVQLKRDLELIAGHCKQFVFISTATVYEHPAHMASEDFKKDVNNLHWSYANNKRKAEIYLEEHYDAFDFMITTVRPCVTYGDTRIPVGMVGRANQWTLIKRILDGKPVVFMEDGNSKHAIAHISTFGDAVVGLFLNPQANHQMYHVADDCAYSWDEIINEVGKILGVKPIVVHVPVSALRWYNKDLYDEMLYDKTGEFTLDNSKIKNISPQVRYHTSLNECLKATIKHLEQNYSSKPLDQSFDEICDMILCDYKNYSLTEEETEAVHNYINILGKKQLNSIKKNARRLKAKNVFRMVKHKIRSFLC